MSACQFEDAGTINRPGTIGRCVRFGNGMGVLAVLIWIVTSYETFMSSENPGVLVATLISLAVFFAFVNFMAIISVGIVRNYDWLLVVLVLAFLSAVVFDFVHYGHFWGPPLGVLALLFMGYVYTHLGLSYIVAGVFAVPG